MITLVQAKSQDCIVVYFDNRSPITVTSDNGTAKLLVDKLLSPRGDMTLSEYQRIMEMEDEITEIVSIEAVEFFDRAAA